MPWPTRAVTSLAAGAAAAALLVGSNVYAVSVEHVPPDTATSTPASVWVAPNGSDNAPGTREAPLRTPQVALDRLDPQGGTVTLRGGTYPGQRIIIDGRSDVTIRAAAGEEPVLDHAGAPAPAGTTGVIEVRGGRDVAIEGLTVTRYRTRSSASTPIGIYATGSTRGLRIEGNHVHHLGNDNPTRGSFEVNAHGIAVYGRQRQRRRLRGE